MVSPLVHLMSLPLARSASNTGLGRPLRNGRLFSTCRKASKHNQKNQPRSMDRDRSDKLFGIYIEKESLFCRQETIVGNAVYGIKCCCLQTAEKGSSRRVSTSQGRNP